MTREKGSKFTVYNFVGAIDSCRKALNSRTLKQKKEKKKRKNMKIVPVSSKLRGSVSKPIRSA